MEFSPAERIKLLKGNERLYRRYTKSPHWRKVRGEVLQQRPVCEACKRRGSRTVHHLTYASLFQEREGDVQALCRYCHAKMHHKL